MERVIVFNIMQSSKDAVLKVDGGGSSVELMFSQFNMFLTILRCCHSAGLFIISLHAHIIV